MLGIDRKTLAPAWTLFLFGLLLVTLYAVRHVLIVFALAIFLAHLLGPAVTLLERYTPKVISRTIALALVYILLLGLIVLVSLPIASAIAAQAGGLASRLPEAVLTQDPVARFPLPGWLEPVRPKMSQLIREQVQQLGQNLLPLLTNAGLRVISGLGNLLSLILIPILSFFFLKDGSGIKESLLNLLEPPSRAAASGVLDDLHLMLTQYIRALVLLSIAVFLTHSAFFTLIGLPYTALLAGVAAALEFIPVAGPLAAGAAILLVAGFSGYPHVLWIALFLAAYRIFQDYVLGPYLMSAGVEVHPVLVLFAVLAGEQVAGVPGMFFAVPVVAALRVVLLRLSRRNHA